MQGSASLIVDRAGVGPGDAILDLACGTGLVARAARVRIGDSGRVVGTDINAGMLAVAGEVAPTVDWIEAPADSLPFEPATFTHVLCQQGFQFFADPTTAACECRRVLVPGGTLAATVWATPGGVPYVEAQLEVLGDLKPDLLPSLRAATPSEAGRRLADVAGRAGFSRVDVSLLEHTVEISDLDGFITAQTSATPWGPALEALDDATRTDRVGQIRDRLGAYELGDGVYAIPFASHMLTAVA
jgi:SAM-dependent methyltransferase